MLRIDTWQPDAGIVGDVGGVAILHGHYFAHAGHTEATFAHLLARHSVDHRFVQDATAWAHEIRGSWDRPAVGDAFAVVGWTTAVALRASLFGRLDALHPVAAFRLLEQPEIARLQRSTHDYVVLREPYGLGNDWPAALAGSVSGFDVDLLPHPGGNGEPTLALELGTYLQRFIGTEFAA